MADFALGLTKTAVEGTLSFVKSAIEQEKKLKEKVEDDLVFITGEFQMMQSFLRVANRERAKNEVVQTWVRQVRNMAFNVEDCVEFVVINIDNRSAMGWLRRSWHTVSQHLRRTVLCCATPPPLDVAVEEIKQLKARVLDVSQRNTRYHLISDDSGSSSKPIMPAEQLAAASMCASALPMLREIWDDTGRRRDIYDLKTLITSEGNDRQVITICASAEVCLEATSILRKAYSDPEICQEFKFRAWGAGLRSDMGELLWQLRRRGVFSILGTGCPDIVDHLKTLMHFEGQKFEHCSLLLLEDSLDEQAFAENLLRDFHLHDEDQDKEVGAEDIKEGTDPIQRCCNFLHKKDCLLIIIGLKSTDDWDTLKSIFFYRLSKGSCILVHTDEANVATYCADHEYRVLRGKDLVAGMLVSDDKEASEEQDYSRIIQSGFMDKNYEMSPRMKEACLWYEFELLGRGEELGKLSNLCKEPPRVVSVWGIAGVGKSALVRKLYFSKMLHLDSRVTKCGSLRRIIAAIGEYFKAITYDMVVSVKQDFIESFGDHFMVALETYPDQGFTSLRGLFSWMQHYIDSRSDSLRPCIFYIPVFPANTKIRRNRLLRRWIAEGYSRDTSRVSAENWGSMFFSQLIDLSIIHQDCKTNLWKVNGFFYEYIITRPTEDNLVFALEDHYAWDNLVSELEGQSDRDSQRTRQHLTIRSSWVRDETVFNSFDFSRLRSLTVFGEWKPFFITKNMKLLRVLDLEGTTHGLTNDDLEQIGKILSRLKFLSLRGCKNIDRLPNSLGGMRLLQTLDVRHTSIVTLPSAIAKLEKLQYIRAGTTVPSNKDWKSTPTEDGDGTGPSQPVAAGPKPVEEADITDPSQLPPPPAAATVPIKTEDGKGIGPSQQTVIDVQVSSWLSKLRCIKRLGNGGVDVPARIGSLMVLHTLGVVNVSGASGKTILKEIKKLTKLRKLGVSGINSGNIEQLWSTISDLCYLESLSVRVDMGKKGSYVSLDGISQLPKTRKSLKLYGHIHRMPLWIRQLGHLKKLDLETTILTVQDIDDVLGELPADVFISLCVKPMVHDELIFAPKVSLSLTLRVLKIDCTSNNLQVKFGYVCVHLLILHCSSGSSLGISGLQNLDELKEVWLKGSYGEALKKGPQRQIEEWPADESVPKPVLKLDE
ncbi:unnamed protein product [Urochloa decumbens]|uniref:Disease resistance protein RPM1 n=1 Tax=Urochloa decumbens TaxID=240449 RepID=A0ABC9AZU8_9POAL